jgi:AcrR family transcriptional regulator
VPATPRTRPAKSALSREAVAAAALGVVDEVGLEAASMRRVAQALDTGPASLYVYVRDRQELMELAYDLALAEVELPTDADGDWRARLELLVDRIVAALAGHADIGAVALGAVPVGPHSLRVNEEALRLLREGGVDDASCAWGADLLGQYIASSAVEEAVWRRAQAEAGHAGGEPPTGAEMGAAYSAHLDRVYGELPAQRYPTLVLLRPLLTRGGGEARAAWKLRVIVDGLLAQG